MAIYGTGAAATARQQRSMLPSDTVFIIGAGASAEARLPVGSQLKTEIAKKLSFEVNDFGSDIKKGDSSIFYALRQRFRQDANTINAYLAAGRRISEGVVLAQSIDDFIDAHQHDELIAHCGKLGIAKAILEAERTSVLFYERTNIYDTVDFARIENTWYMGFFRLLSQQVSKKDVGSIFRNVTIICFNYDRCIEHFLVHALSRHYQMTVEQAGTLAQENLKIFRPYGVVGPYFGPQRIEFGLKGMPDFDSVVNSLRTYSEQVHDENELRTMRAAVTKASTLVFLGNAYHANNMALLTKGNDNLETKRIFGTRMGISNEDLRVVKQLLLRTYRRGQPQPQDHQEYGFAPTCSELFRDYHLSLRQ